MANKSLELLIREMIDVLTGRVKVALIANPLPVSGTVTATIVNPLPVSGNVNATLVANPLPVSGNVNATLVANPLPVSGNVNATLVANPLPISGSVTATVASTVISSFTKPYILPVYIKGASVGLDISGGASQRAGPLAVGGIYRVCANVSIWLDQGDVAVVAVAGEHYLEAGAVAFIAIVTNLDYIAAISESGAIAGARCSISLVTML